MIKLSTEQVLTLHSELIKTSGGIDGIRDEGLLISALKEPFQTFANVNLYPTIIDKIARTCFGLIKNHPFIDGNKRIGVHVMLILLELNFYKIEYTQKELSTIILEIASNEKDYMYLVEWINIHLVIE
ncbi:MAG: type II toxin-antitoxin system death-on-curing family toxin [Lachnospiraceae bacterium]|jgi:death-on-curing protein|nr:type II toxin-antitoxin system death-on-curing family toxin [Lachnospiraceae bacterium]